MPPDTAVTEPNPQVTNPSDADSQPAADAAPDPIEAEIDAFLGGGKEGTDGAPETGEGLDSSEPDEFADARDAAAKAAAEKAERETRQKSERESKQRQEQEQANARQQQFEQSYRQRMENAKSLAQELQEEGLDSSKAEAIAKRISDDFNSHHADGKKLYEPEVRQETDSAYRQLLNDGFREALGDKAEQFFGTEDAPKQHNGLVGALEAYKEIVMDGMLSQAEADAQKKKALLDYRRKLENEGLIQGSKSGQNVEGGEASSAGQQMTAEQAATMPIGELVARQRTR